MVSLRQSRKNILLLLFVILGAQSCINKEDFEFDKFVGIKASPSVAVPLLYGTLTIGDLLHDDSLVNVEEDKDGLIHVILQDTLRSASIRDHFLLPQLNHSESYPVLLNPLSTGGTQVVVEEQELLNVGFPDADFETIKLKEGNATIRAGNSMSSVVDLTISFPTLKKEGKPLVMKMSLPAGSLYTKKTLEADLNGYEADFSGSGTGQNFLPFEIRGETDNANGSATDVQDEISFDLVINGLKFSLLTGNFGQPEVELPAEEIPIALFEKLLSKGNFGIKEPLLSFEVLNSNGVPLRVFANKLQARNSQGEVVQINTTPSAPMDILYPSVFGETSITTLKINNTSEIIDLAPSYIEYGLRGQLNMTPATGLNFITDRSEIAVVFNADIPLWGYLEGISLSDTLPIELGLQDINVNEASLRLVVENEFPLEAQIQIDFVNENDDVLETLFTGDYETLLPASTVDSNGELASAGKYNKDIEFTPERFERILTANKMIIRAHLFTSQGADGTFPHVKIKSGYKLKVDLGVKTTADLIVKF